MTQRTITFTEAVFALDEERTVNLGSLTITPNDLIVLIGGNGSGKTSIAKALNGEVPLTPVYPYLRAIFSTVE